MDGIILILASMNCLALSIIGIKQVKKYITNKKRLKYSLDYIKSLRQNIELKAIPYIKRKINDLHFHSIRTQLIPYIKELKTALITDIDEDVMNKINNNLETVDYKIRLDEKQIPENILGLYIGQDHSIYLPPKVRYGEDKALFKDTLMHELIHASSSRQDTFNQSSNGFSKIISKTQSMGYTLNEGYTELLNKRYFGYGKRKTYLYETKVASVVELLVGKSKMTSLYFDTNLYGLIEELSKYQTKERVNQFILDLDLISYLKNIINYDGYLPKEYQQLLIETYNRINTFLYQSFSNKTDIYFNKVGLSEYLKESKEFMSKLNEISNYAKAFNNYYLNSNKSSKNKQKCKI